MLNPRLDYSQGEKRNQLKAEVQLAGFHECIRLLRAETHLTGPISSGTVQGL